MGPAPPLLPSQKLPLPGRTPQGSLGPACLLAGGQDPETNGWCKWVFGGTARPRHSPAGSLQLRPPLWATLPSGPPRLPRLPLQAGLS